MEDRKAIKDEAKKLIDSHIGFKIKDYTDIEMRSTICEGIIHALKTVELVVVEASKWKSSFMGRNRYEYWREVRSEINNIRKEL